MGVLFIYGDVKFERRELRKRSFDHKTSPSIPCLPFDLYLYFSVRVLYRIEHIRVI